MFKKSIGSKFCSMSENIFQKLMIRPRSVICMLQKLKSLSLCIIIVLSVYFYVFLLVVASVD